MLIILKMTDEYAAASGVAYVEREYCLGIGFIDALQDLMEISGVTGAEVVAVEVRAGSLPDSLRHDAATVGAVIRT